MRRRSGRTGRTATGLSSRACLGTLAGALALAVACGDSQPGASFNDAGAGGNSSKPDAGGAGKSQGGSGNDPQGGNEPSGGSGLGGAGMPAAGLGGQEPGTAGTAAGEGFGGGGGSTDAGAGGEAAGGLGGEAGNGGSSGESSVGGAVSEGGGGGQPQAPECPKPEGQLCHEFFATDNARNQLLYVNEFEPAMGWSKSVDDTTVHSPRNPELVDNAASSNGKAILVSVNKGYQEYDLATGARLVNVVVPGTTGVRGAVRLPSGNTALGIGDNKLRVVDNLGATVGQECTLPGAGADSLRVLERDPATGFILFGRLRDLLIVKENCQQQWTAKLPAGSKAYSVLPRAGGGVWASTGTPATVLEYDQASAVVGQVGGKSAHPEVDLDFFAGFDRLPSGNVVVANWLGHVVAPEDDTPHLIELTPNNELVWKWGNQVLARQIGDVHVLR